MPNRNAFQDVYLAKNEVTEGTDPVPTPTANAIELMEHFEPDDDMAFKPEAESRVRGLQLNPGDPMSVAGNIMSQSRKAFLRGTTNAPSSGNRIELDPWFLSSGMSATYDATPGQEKVTYICADTSLGTMTEYYYRDGLRYIYTGVRCEWMYSFDVGGASVITINPSGRVAGVSDQSVPTNQVYPTTDWPLAVDSTVFTIDGFTAGVIRHWEHSLGNVVQRRDGVKAQGGVQGWRIASRNVTWKCTLEGDLLGTKNWRTLRDNKTPIAITFLIGGLPFNRQDFSAARAFIRKITPSNDGGLDLITLEGTLRGTTPFSLAIR